MSKDKTKLGQPRSRAELNRRRRAGVGALFDSDDLPGCEIYVALRDRINVRCAAARAHCEELWQCFQRHADRNYIPEFRLRLHQRWFEMYLTVALKRAGYSIEDVGTGPDICASIGGRRVWIEATCSEPGASDNPDAVPAKVYDQVQGAPINQMTLRILNSLDVKQEKLAKYRALGTIGDSDIALVAINIFEVPGGFEDVSIAFERALFGFAGTEVIIDRQSGREIHRRRRHQVEITRSKSGKPVDVQPFANDKLPHVAGRPGFWHECTEL